LSVTSLRIEAHPLLDAAVFVSEWPAPLHEIVSPDWLLELLADEAGAPLSRSEAVRTAVRDLLRHGGYKPSGRGKPASEYLARAAAAGSLSSINAAVDACNGVSLHSALPISVVDLDRLRMPDLRIALAPAGARYAFNPSGQEIALEGLLCLFDGDGPCANAVRDSQRTKTGEGTRRCLSVVWGSRALPGRTEQAVGWYRDLLARAGAESAMLRPS
jgi:DNA/RNA-binding domain of Phe-tRNA-synthetase-like protein